MTIRLKCPSCNTAFLAPADRAGRRVACPKCGAKQVVPGGPDAPAAAKTLPASAPRTTPTPAPAPEPTTTESVFVPNAPPKAPSKLRRFVLGFVTLAAVSGVGLAVAWPRIQDWLHPKPKDPVEQVAAAYLDAIKEGNSEVIQKLGVIETPPAIRSYRKLRRDRTRNTSLKDSFAPVSAFHARISKDYDYDSASQRFTPKNALGPAAEVLDALHDAKAKADQDKINEKIRSGDPNDLFDAAEALAKPLASLSETILAPKKIVPTYQMLVDDAKPPLPDGAKALAHEFGTDPETWQALLKRPFLTLKADGPFVLDRAEVETEAVDALGSSGDPPVKLHLTLTRFRLEGIDTGWKVTATRRGDAPPPTPAVPPPTYDPATGAGVKPPG